MRGATILSLSASAVAFLHVPLAAQSLPDTAPAIPRDDPEYEIDPTRIGPFDVTVGVGANTYYDSNLYARPDNEVDDIVFELSPFATAALDNGKTRLEFGTQSVVRRHLDQTSEDAESARFFGDFSWTPEEGETLSLGAQFERAIEDRGDPESRNLLAPGPRELDIWSGEVRYRRDRGKILVDLRGEVADYNALSALDDDRDFAAYAGSATVGVNLGGSIFATVTGFASRREFAIDTTPLGLERDSTTYGGRVGIDISPGGLIDGSLSAGVFRFEPDEPTFDARTGFSLAGNLVYRPQRRTALVLSASNGDVTTFRTGATGRTDFSTRLTWQQEIRHNLFSSLGGGYRRTKYRGTGLEEDTLIGRAEVEYVASRHMSFVAQASYGERGSDIPTDEFERIRAGVGLRLRF